MQSLRICDAYHKFQVNCAKERLKSIKLHLCINFLLIHSVLNISYLSTNISNGGILNRLDMISRVPFSITNHLEIQPTDLDIF